MPTSDWTPTVSDVGAILRSRTVDVNGSEVGTFNDDTRPTGAQVTTMVGQVVGRVAAEAGEIPEALYADARLVAAERAAMQVELTFFPEQVASGASPYAQLRDQYKEDLALLVTAVGELGAGDQLGEGDDYKLPVYSFPENQDGFVDWRTNF